MATPRYTLLGAGTGPELAPMMKLLAERGARTDLKNRSGIGPSHSQRRTDRCAARLRERIRCSQKWASYGAAHLLVIVIMGAGLGIASANDSAAPAVQDVIPRASPASRKWVPQ